MKDCFYAFYKLGNAPKSVSAGGLPRTPGALPRTPTGEAYSANTRPDRLTCRHANCIRPTLRSCRKQSKYCNIGTTKTDEELNTAAWRRVWLRDVSCTSFDVQKDNYRILDEGGWRRRRRCNLITVEQNVRRLTLRVTCRIHLLNHFISAKLE